VECAHWFKTVADGISGEKTLKSCEISDVVALVMLIFVFFPFPGSTRDCNVAEQKGGPISRCWNVVVSVWVAMVVYTVVGMYMVSVWQEALAATLSRGRVGPGRGLFRWP
jgi:hypothetical protein